MPPRIILRVFINMVRGNTFRRCREEVRRQMRHDKFGFTHSPPDFKRAEDPGNPGNTGGNHISFAVLCYERPGVNLRGIGPRRR